MPARAHDIVWHTVLQLHNLTPRCVRPTEQAHLCEVVSVVLQYIEMLRRQGPQRRLCIVTCLGYICDMQGCA